MNVLFRFDCSSIIGMGHMVRCLALAKALQARSEITVIINQDPHNQINEMLAYGYKCYEITKGTPERIKWDQDASSTIKIIQNHNKHYDWIVIDHYGLDNKWEKALQPYTKRMLVIDDLANRPHDCDILLDQNAYQDQSQRYESLIPSKTLCLLGPQYAILRSQFLTYRLASKPEKSSFRILISFGGGDCAEITIKAIQACLSLKNKNLDIDVIISSICTRQEEIKSLCKKYNFIKLHHHIENMAKLMASADLALGAGGSSVWERCAVGLPSIVLTLADNQIKLAKHAAKLGVLYYLGDGMRVKEQTIVNALQVCINSPQTLAKMRETCLKLVDGKGCQRILTQLVANDAC